MISDPVRETLKDQPEEESNSDAKGSMRLLFKDMVIEFEKKDLSYVIRSIRQ